MTRPIFTIILAVALRTIAVSAGPVEIGQQVAAAGAACFEVVVILLLLLQELLLDDATGFCRSYIDVNTTITKTQTTVIPRTAVSTVPLTTVVTTTAAGGAAPTVTQIVYSNCGLIGYVKETPAYYFDGSGTYGTFDPCSQKCTQDAGCVSFAFGSGQCLLFNTTVTTNVNPAASSPFTFYDRRCPASSLSPSARPRAENNNNRRDITTRHTITLPGITLGTPSSATTRPPPPPPPPPHSTSLSLNISNTTFVSSACSCLVGSAQTNSVTVVQVITRTSQVNVVTSAVVATKVETVFTNTNTNAVTVTVTTTA